jgi:hypothetical protein
MIICMLVMLELCIRVYSKSMRHHLPTNQQNILNSKESTCEMTEKRFTDCEIDYFWKWTT